MILSSGPGANDFEVLIAQPFFHAYLFIILMLCIESTSSCSEPTLGNVANRHLHAQRTDFNLSNRLAANRLCSETTGYQHSRLVRLVAAEIVGRRTFSSLVFEPAFVASTATPGAVCAPAEWADSKTAASASISSSVS